MNSRGTTTLEAIVSRVGSVASDGLVVEWASSTGHVYDVEATDMLPGTFTSVVENVVATPPMNTYTDHVNDVERRFYRIRGWFP